MCYEASPFVWFLVYVRDACGSLDGLRNYCGLHDCVDYAKFF